jgi:hypothetical protein
LKNKIHRDAQKYFSAIYKTATTITEKSAQIIYFTFFSLPKKGRDRHIKVQQSMSHTP